MKRILCYGDSNTFGADPEFETAANGEKEDRMYRLPADSRWPKVLQSLLRTEEYEIIEEGLNGRTTVFKDHAWPYCDGREYFTPCVLSKLPLDLIIIMLGTNDLKTAFAPSADSAGLAMSEFLKVACNPFLYQGYPMPKLLLVSPIFIGEKIEKSCFAGMFNNKSLEVSKMLPTIYSDLAKAFGCEFMKASDFAGPSDADCLHMDAENQRKLAAGIRDKILEIFAD